MIVRSADAPVQTVDSGVTRQVLSHDPHLMMVKVTFAKGAVGYVHTHPHRQASYVERGRLQFTFDGVVSEIASGDSFLVPPGVPHGVVALEDGVLIDVFTPAREDFIK